MFLFIQSFFVHNMYDMLMCLFKSDIKFNKCIIVHLDVTQAVTSISNQKLSHFAAVSAGPSTSKIGDLNFFLYNNYAIFLNCFTEMKYFYITSLVLPAKLKQLALTS